ncbi:LacI family transcriptional regulator [bacterium]|nr:MAG: LacI family transcriptional regulator [bacterium]
MSSNDSPVDVSHPAHTGDGWERVGSYATHEPRPLQRRPIVLFVYEGYEHGEIHSAYGQDLLTGLVEGGLRAGVDLLIASDTRELHATGDLSGYFGRFDAVVLSVPPRDSRLPSAILRTEAPTMVIGQRATFDIPHVFADDATGVTKAMQHLYDLGHRRIAHIAGPLHHDDALDRLSAFSTFGRSRSLAMPDRWIAMGDYTFPGPVEELTRMLSLPDRPTAVFAANDEMAIGVIKVAKEMRLRVPEDLSVVGFDDSPASRFSTPGLTTVRQPVFEMSHACLAALAKCLKTGGRPTDILLATELLVRGSTAPPPEDQI